MSTTVESAVGSTRRARRTAAAVPAAVAVDITPLSAREAVGRSTGLRSVPMASARTPLWKSAGIVGLIAIVAAGALPLVAGALSIPL